MFKKKKENQIPLSRVRQPQLTSSTQSSSVFSYHASRAARPGVTGRQEQAPPAVAARRKRPLRRGPIIVLLCVVLILAVGNVFLNRRVEVLPLRTVQGAIFLQSQQAYETAVREELEKSIWNSTKLTVNTSKLAATLKARFPELSHVTVTVPLVGNHMQVYIEPAKPSLLLSSGSEVFVLDDAGRALIRANQVPHIDKLNLPVVLDQSGLPVALGRPALPSTSVVFITEVVGQLKAKSIPISSLTLPPAASELDVKVSGLPYSVKFNLRGNAREEAGTFIAVKQQLERDHVTPGQYIDVRVDERVYYQ